MPLLELIVRNIARYPQSATSTPIRYQPTIRYLLAWVGYTSYADAGTIPGHYVLFWGARGHDDTRAASVFEDCCLATKEALNSVFRQGRAADRSIGSLEIRVVFGTFDKLAHGLPSPVAPPSTSTRRLMTSLIS
jgi:hypothetical protein